MNASKMLGETQEALKALSPKLFSVCNIKELVIAIETQSIIIKKDLAALSGRVCNHSEKFSEIGNCLKRPNGTLNWLETLNQPKEASEKQNEATQALNMSGNNLEKQTILLLGGDDGMNGDSLVMLENNGQRWKQLNIELPYAVCSHGAQFLNNNLYIYGGWNSRHKELNWTYKLSKGLQWKKTADMGLKRKSIANSSVIFNKQIWVCGGWNREEKRLKSVEMYDPLTNKWKFMKQMNECRRNAAAAVVNGKIYCCGGYELQSVEFYDQPSDVWTLVATIEISIDRHGAVEMNGSFMVMGGYHNEYLKNVWALDTTDKNAKWIEKPFLSIPHCGASVAKIGGQVFICGGHGDAGDSVEVFDGKVWKSGPKMPTPRNSNPVVVIPIQYAIKLERFTAVPTKEESWVLALL